MLIRPDTFVNNTGEAVSALVKKYDPKAADILVVCDDVNLDFGKLRLRASGSAGGHHGLESVIASLGSGDFPRLRVGVRKPDMPRDLAGFVLEKFSQEEEGRIGAILDGAASVCVSWAREGFEAAMNRLSQHLSVK